MLDNRKDLNPSDIQITSFFQCENIKKHRPLFLSSSGGGGHIAAIEAIQQHLFALRAKKEIELSSDQFPLYRPKTPAEKPRDLLKAEINLGLSLPSFMKTALEKIGLPTLPDYKEVEDEVAKLTKNNRERSYIDMLIDIYPSGHEDVAIWHILYRKNKIETLKKVLYFQKYNDYHHHNMVRDHFLNLLEQAAQQGLAYTEIISTQAMALSGLCAAVIKYNEAIADKYRVPTIKIHQFLTDLPSKGAVHYLESLRRLSDKERAQMILYGVNLHKSQEFLLPGFAKLVNLDPAKNPMVRTGFSHHKLTKINSASEVGLHAQVKNNKDRFFQIKATDKVAAIMLGSLAMKETIDYVKQLLSHKSHNKIFVFCGNNADLKKTLANLPRSPEVELNLLDQQDDKHIAPIMARSNLVIICGGGLSIMEQMAIPHDSNQTILMHSNEDNNYKLSSDLIWEDFNVDGLKEHLIGKGIHASRTSVKIFQFQLEILEKNKLNEDEINNLFFLKSQLTELLTTITNVLDDELKKTNILPLGRVIYVNQLAADLRAHLESLGNTVDVENKVAQVGNTINIALHNDRKHTATFFVKNIFYNDPLSNGLRHAAGALKKRFPAIYQDKTMIPRESSLPLLKWRSF